MLKKFAGRRKGGLCRGQCLERLERQRQCGMAVRGGAVYGAPIGDLASHRKCGAAGGGMARA